MTTVPHTPARHRMRRPARFLLFPILTALLGGCGEGTPPAGPPQDALRGESALEHAARHLDPVYVCPMHPRIVRKEPGATCPICGMDLVKQKPVTSKEPRPEVELSADVIQKLGVRTTRVEKGRLWKYIKTVGYVGYNERRLSTVWVEADVFEHQLEWVERGQSADVRVQALPGQRWDGRVNYIYPELDPRTRTLKVRLLVPNPDGTLKPNMFAQVEIYGGPKEAVLKIPSEALIVTGERESVVLALGEGRFKPVDVVTGMRSRGEVEIYSGLEAGDEVVVSGQFLIDSEANLRASFRRFESGDE